MTLQAGAGQGGWAPTGKLSPGPGGNGQDTDALSVVVEPNPATGSALPTPVLTPWGPGPLRTCGGGGGGVRGRQLWGPFTLPSGLAAAQNFLQKERAPGDETAQPHPSGSA